MFWDLVRRLVVAALLLGAGGMVGSWLAGVTRETLERLGLDPRVRRLATGAVRPVVTAIAAVAALDVLRLDPIGLVVVLAAGALAVAIGSRDLVRDGFAGAVLLTTRPYSAGDAIEVAGHAGTVVELGLLVTRLRAADGALVSLPNHLVLGAPIRTLPKGNP